MVLHNNTIQILAQLVKRFAFILFYIDCVFSLLYAQEPTQTKIHKKLSLIIAGDAILHSNVYNDAAFPCDTRTHTNPFSNTYKIFWQDSRIKTKDATSQAQKNKAMCYDFSSMLSIIALFIKQHDLAFYNQESILGGKELSLSGYPTFNSPQEFGDEMLKIGFNLISLANNHTMDRGEKAIIKSLQYWKTKQALSAGSYESFNDREQPRIMQKNGITYTMLAYSYGTNGFIIPKGKEYLVNIYTKEQLQADIAKVRKKVDLLIVSMHWGVEYTFKPTKEQEELANFLAQQGVDIVIGNHPHVIQPIELINKTLVIYSLGNLLSAQVGLEKQIGMLVSLDITKDSQNNIVLQDIATDLVYTYHNSKMRDFKIYPFSFLNEAMLPNYQKLYKDYLNIVLSRDTKKRIKIGISY